jgi:hypothetical protein
MFFTIMGAAVFAVIALIINRRQQLTTTSAK